MAKQTASEKSEESALCTKCGAQIDGDVKFCPSCGTAVQQAAPKEATEKKPVNCPKCGKPVDEGVKFCPSCGTAVTQAAPKEVVERPVNCTKCGKKLPDDVKFCPSCGASVAGSADSDDAEQNKGMAIIAYILFFVPLISGDHKKSPFVKFHTNQGTVLAIVDIGMWVVWSILRGILGAIFNSLRPRMDITSIADITSMYSRAAATAKAALVFLQISSIVTWVLGLLTLALFIIGIINASQGKMKPLPVIGKFTIIK